MSRKFYYYTTTIATTKDCLEEAHNNLRREEALDPNMGKMLHLFDPGLTISHAAPFPTEEDAIEYCKNSDHHTGTSAVAVPFNGEVDDIQEGDENPILMKAQKSWENLQDLQETLYNEMQGAKSNTIGCKGCGSSFPRARLADMTCPLCKTHFHSPTNKKKLESAHKKLNKAREALYAIETQKVKGIQWVIGGYSQA